MTGHTFRHHPLLGTSVEVRVDAATGAQAERLDAVVVDEIARLERTFSVFDPTSELECWKRGEVDAPTTEFCEAMRAAYSWQVRSGGAFNTSAGTLTALWRRAVDRGRAPTDAELAAAVVSIAEPAYDIDRHGVPRLVGDGAGIVLNAFVKGWIVDRAAALAARTDPTAGVLVNAGGDLRHVGPGIVRVGIENPLRPYDNEPPVARVGLAGAGLATSGRARRGVRLDGRWYSHVIDPRTGRPVDHLASISVIAADAATADVVATIAGMHPPGAAVELASKYGVACLAIDPDGRATVNDRWRRFGSAT